MKYLCLSKEDKLRPLIVKHTRLNMSIRKKLKVMIQKMPVPDLVERKILDFVGLKQFRFR